VQAVNPVVLDRREWEFEGYRRAAQLKQAMVLTTVLLRTTL
jgi:hypothetical protein